MSNGDARRVRRLHELSQQEVADELGISKEAVSKYERHQRATAGGYHAADVLAAIDRIVERKRREQQG